ncbi:hypothetical protein Tco_0048671 [Tanacetum coccineum]
MLLPCPGSVDGQRFLSDPGRLFLLVDLTAPILTGTRDVLPGRCYPPRRAPRRSEACRRWCAAPLSTWYPPTTSESSSGYSSERPMHLSSHFAGPSRKRCRSPVDSVPLSTPVTRSLAPTRADLLPPRKDIKVKKSKNEQKPTRNEETSTRERYEERYQSRISLTTREESQ